MKAIYEVPAPAKLNLFLHIVGRRADGYHLLQSAFMLIDWCDRLHFERRADGRISREDLRGALPEDDLIVRAARALQAHTGCALGAHIGVEKHIPAQAGLGGGSSDAASTLLALKQLWGLKLDRGTLLRIGERLGADVPFFLGGGSAWVEGIGEQLTPISLPPARFVVVKPAAGVETARLFQSPTLKRDEIPATIAGFAADPYGFGHNALQTAAQAACPEIGDALAWLASQGLTGRMTGSGSAVFARLDPAGNGVSADARPGWQLRVCSNMPAHPLSGWAARDN